MCVLAMLKSEENRETEEIDLAITTHNLLFPQMGNLAHRQTQQMNQTSARFLVYFSGDFWQLDLTI